MKRGREASSVQPVDADVFLPYIAAVEWFEMTLDRSKRDDAVETAAEQSRACRELDFGLEGLWPRVTWAVAAADKRLRRQSSDPVAFAGPHRHPAAARSDQSNDGRDV